MDVDKIEMDTLKIIKTRRSIRKFKDVKIPAKIVKGILEAGRWAPSGLNNQPWKFMVLEANKKNVLAKYTKYSSIIKSSSLVILVFLNKDSSYNQEKDFLAIGAAIQNMLLYIHSKKYGACWLGEILNQRTKIHRFFKTPKSLQLEAVLAVGYPLICVKGPTRKNLKNLILK